MADGPGTVWFWTPLLPAATPDTQEVVYRREETHSAATVRARKDPAPGLNLAQQASHGPLSAADQAISTVQGTPSPPF